MQILGILFAGLIGTACMTTVMMLIQRAKWAEADMVRALGSLATGSMERALPVGVLIHAAAGMAFAFPYVILLTAFELPAGFMSVLVAGVVGLFHGIVVSYILHAAVSLRHPIERFQKAGFEVGLAHIAGHVAYGVGLGLTYAFFGLHWSLS